MRENRRPSRMTVRTLLALGIAGAVVVFGACRRPPPPPNIVLVVIDTARADHFSGEGYPLSTTPRVDAFAREAIRFTQAYSVSSWTLPSHASLFTGLFPSAHGATQEHLQLDDSFDTLAELLHGRGFATAGFSGNPWVTRSTHLNQGFDDFEEMWGLPESREDGAVPHATNRRIFNWLARRPNGQPFFLFINYIEPHFPYNAPDKYSTRFVAADATPDELTQAAVPFVEWYLHPRPVDRRLAAIRTALYDAELAYVDDIVGELFEGLRRAHVYEDSMIVITSDHGENLGDHGHVDHVFSLYNSTLHVPLLVRLPGGVRGGTTRNEPVQLTDVFTTLTAAAGLAPQPERTGLDLLSGTPLPQRPVFAEYHYPAQALAVFPPAEQSNPILDRFRRRLRSLQDGTHKVIWGSDGRHELYDLATDPGEQHDIMAQSPQVAAPLLAQLQAMVERFPSQTAPPQPSPQFDANTQQRMRDLGYLR